MNMGMHNENSDRQKMILDTATGKWWFLETDEPSPGRVKSRPKKVKLKGMERPS